MRKTAGIFLLVPLLFSCGAHPKESAMLPSKVSSAPAPTSALIYFSRTGHTKPIAEEIASVQSLSAYELKAKTPYSDADIAYANADCRANIEQNNPSSRPDLAEVKSDLLSGVNLLYLGYPIWWGKAPRLIFSFLDGYDLTGKTIIPFCTSASTGIEGSVAELVATYPAASFQAGKRFSIGESLADVDQWLATINV